MLLTHFKNLLCRGWHRSCKSAQNYYWQYWVGLFATSICIAIWVAPIEVMLSHFVADDYFYYLVFAENWVSNQTPSFDGLSITNGFHPLFMGVCILLRFVLGHGDSLVKAGLVFLALSHTCTTFFLIKYSTEKLGNIGAIATICIAYNPLVLSVVLSGHETALFACLLVLTFGMIERYLRTGTLRYACFVGVLSGATSAARMDGLLFLPILAILPLLCTSSKRDRRIAIGHSVVMIACCLVWITPFMLWGKRFTGNYLPGSLRALQFWYFGEIPFIDLLQGDFSFVAVKWGQSLTFITDWAAAWGGVSSFEDGKLSASVFVYMVGCLGVIGLFIMRRETALAPIVFLFLLFHFVYYFMSATLNPRYMFVEILLVPLAALFTVTKIWPIVFGETSRVKYWLAAAALLVFMSNMFLSSISAWSDERSLYNSWHALHRPMYVSVSRVIEHVVPHGNNFGAFNAGIIAYSCKRRVVNLDGVMNNQILRAMKRKNIRRYLRENEIQYVGDWGIGQIDYFMKKGGWVDWKKYAQLRASVAPPAQLGRQAVYWVLVEIEP